MRSRVDASLDVARAALVAIALALSLASGPAHAVAVGLRSPSWAEVSTPDKAILAPLAAEWDKLDNQRKQKWLGIAKRYPTLTSPEQQRIHQQMGVWSKLTPEQRRQARERYKSLKKLPPEKRAEMQEKWQEYQQLPPERRRELGSRPRSTASNASKPALGAGAAVPAGPAAR